MADIDIAGLMGEIIRNVEEIEQNGDKPDKLPQKLRLHYIRDIARQVQRNTDVGGWS